MPGQEAGFPSKRGIPRRLVRGSTLSAFALFTSSRDTGGRTHPMSIRPQEILVNCRMEHQVLGGVEGWTVTERIRIFSRRAAESAEKEHSCPDSVVS